MCVGHFQVVTCSTKSIPIVFINRQCLGHLNRCWDEYRKYNNSVLDESNLLSSQNNNSSLLKLLPQMINPRTWIKPVNLWHMHQWCSNLEQHFLLKSQVYCTAGKYPHIYPCVCDLRCCFHHGGHMVRESLDLWMVFLDETSSRSWQHTIFCHTIHSDPLMVWGEGKRGTRTS